MSKIIAIGTATPAYKHDQDAIGQFMRQAYNLEKDEARKLDLLYYRSNIKSRYSCLPDYSLPMSEWTFYPKRKDLEHFPNIDQRLAVYDKEALPLALKAVHNTLSEGFEVSSLTHVISISCTGMSAPGLDIALVQALGLHKNTQRSSINFMGCYAAVHALKMADAICKADTRAKVLLVCVELCTLHFQKEATFNNQMASLLFADGTAAAIVVGDACTEKGYALHDFYSELASAGASAMSWHISQRGFLMHLDNYVPDLVAQHIAPMLEGAMQAAGVSKTNISQWAIHPGGKKIIEAATQALELSKNNVSTSYSILSQYGNMSSATILFVLQEILFKEVTPQAGTYTFGVAFGPGITMESLFIDNTIS